MNDIILDDRALWLDYFKSQCARCKLYNDLNASCKAFPNGIPFNMLEGKITHEKEIKGQTGNFLFTPKEIE
jgi:hypothetical protein|nr:MAG TPA: hypothetical protein [Caudoviricetes sp.]